MCIYQAQDIEKIGFSFIMFIGKINLEHVIVFSVLQAATKKQKYERISEKKMSTAVEILCKVSVKSFEPSGRGQENRKVQISNSTSSVLKFCV